MRPKERCDVTTSTITTVDTDHPLIRLPITLVREEGQRARCVALVLFRDSIVFVKL